MLAFAVGRHPRVLCSAAARALHARPLSPVLGVQRRWGHAGGPHHKPAAPAADGSVTTVPSQPPFPLRVLLVGSTVGLATPIFAAASVVVAWHRVLPSGSAGRAIKVAVALVIGGGLASLSYNYIIPFLREHADFVLPFALANAAAASFWYALLEWTIGLELMGGRVSTAQLGAWLPDRLSTLLHSMVSQPTLRTGLPLGGVLAGVATALTAQLLWPLLISLTWSDEMKALVLGPNEDSTFLIDLWSHLVLPVGLPVGVAAGYGLHLVLAPVLVGDTRFARGRTWHTTSLPLLCGILGMSALYFTRCRPLPDDLFWEERLDVETGEKYSFNIRTQQRSKTTWDADKAAATRTFSSFAHFARRPIGYLMDKAYDTEAPQQRGVVAFGKDGDVAVRDVDAHARLFQVVDMLARLNHIDRRLASEWLYPAHLEEERRDLLEYCKQRYGILLEELETDLCAIIALQREYQEAKRAPHVPSAPGWWGWLVGDDREQRAQDARHAIGRAKTHALRNVVHKPGTEEADNPEPDLASSVGDILCVLANFQHFERIHAHHIVLSDAKERFLSVERREHQEGVARARRRWWARVRRAMVGVGVGAGLMGAVVWVSGAGGRA